MTDEAKSVVGAILFCLGILSVGGYASFQLLQADTAEPQSKLAAQNVVTAQRPEPEYVSVTPDLEGDQLFREFQAYRHWGLGRQ